MEQNSPKILKIAIPAAVIIILALLLGPAVYEKWLKPGGGLSKTVFTPLSSLTGDIIAIDNVVGWIAVRNSADEVWRVSLKSAPAAAINKKSGGAVSPAEAKDFRLMQKVKVDYLEADLDKASKTVKPLNVTILEDE